MNVYIYYERNKQQTKEMEVFQNGRTNFSKKQRGTNRVEVPEARGALDKFKFEVANEIGVDLKDGYNGHLTTAQAGSVGGEMVRKMIRRQEEEMSR